MKNLINIILFLFIVIFTLDSCCSSKRDKIKPPRPSEAKIGLLTIRVCDFKYDRLECAAPPKVRVTPINLTGSEGFSGALTFDLPKFPGSCNRILSCTFKKILPKMKFGKWRVQIPSLHYVCEITLDKNKPSGVVFYDKHDRTSSCN